MNSFRSNTLHNVRASTFVNSINKTNLKLFNQGSTVSDDSRHLLDPLVAPELQQLLGKAPLVIDLLALLQDDPRQLCCRQTLNQIEHTINALNYAVKQHTNHNTKQLQQK